MMRPWHYVAVWLWVGYCVFSIHARGLELSLDKNPTDRMRFHAIPVAISSLYLGWPADYTGMKSMSTHFQVAGPLEPIIHWAVAYQPPAVDGVYYWAADDRGMADYVIWAFWLFGPGLRGLYLFYFVFLGATCVLFLLEARRRPEMHALLIFTLAAMYASLGVIPLANLSPTAFDPVTIYEPRTIEVLSFIPTLHLAFAGLLNPRWTRGRVLIAALQAILLVWCYLARSSMAWQVGFIGLVSVSHMAWSWFRDRRAGRQGPSLRRWFLRPGAAPLVIVAAAFTGLVAYQHLVFHPAYFKEWGARVVWHNALMAVGSDSELGPKYKLSVSDADSIEAVLTYLRNHNDPRLNPEWTMQTFLNSFGSHVEVDWTLYDQAARDLYFQIWRENPRGMVRLYTVKKPLEIYSMLLGATRMDPMAQRNIHGLYFSPLSAGALVLAFPGLLLALGARARLGALAFWTPVLFVMGLVPGVLFYSVALTMMGAFVALALSIYLLATATCTFAGRARAAVPPRP